MAGFVEDAVRLAGGEALVPQVNRKGGEFAQFGGKGFSAGGAGALVAGKVARMAHHNGGYAKPPRQARQRAEVFAEIAFPLQRQDGLGGEAQFVGNGYADALCADVEAEVSRRWVGFQRGLLLTSLKPGPPLR